MKNIKLFVTFVASLFFLFSCEKEKVETCGFDTIRLTESFLTEYAKGDGVDNYMIALASGPTVFDPTNQQWHTENDVLKKMSINYTIPEKTVLAPWYR